MQTARTRLGHWWLVLAVPFLGPPLHAAQAEDWYGGKFQLGIGAYFPSVNTIFRADGSNGELGTEVSLENTLGASDNENSAIFGFTWNISRRNTLQATAYRVNRTGFATTNGEIRIGDTVFPVETDLNTDLDTDVVFLAWGYSFIRSEKALLGARIGFHITDLKMAFVTPDDVLDEQAEVTAPLPTIGLYGGISLGKRWEFYGDLGAFALSIGEYSGSILSAGPAVYFHAWRHVGFGLGYYYFKIDLEVEAGVDDDFRGIFEYEYAGAAAFLMLRF